MTSEISPEICPQVSVHLGSALPPPSDKDVQDARAPREGTVTEAPATTGGRSFFLLPLPTHSATLVHPLRVSGPDLAVDVQRFRATPLAGAAEAGNVLLCRGCGNALNRCRCRAGASGNIQLTR